MPWMMVIPQYPCMDSEWMLSEGSLNRRQISVQTGISPKSAWIWAHLQAVHLQAALVIDVHVLLLSCCKELLIVENCHVPGRFSHLQHVPESVPRQPQTDLSVCSESSRNVMRNLSTQSTLGLVWKSLSLLSSQLRISGRTHMRRCTSSHRADP